MKSKKIIALILLVNLLISLFAVESLAENEQSVFHVDSLNGTRWADYICVYQGMQHTGQNEWGENIVVDATGTVIEKIPGADIRGKNLAIPDGGMVVSGTGDIGKAMYDSADIGDKCLFDEYGMRVYFSKSEINPFYEKTLRVTGYNDVRWADTVIIYNQSGKQTDTNAYGYEVCVDADGYIISSGGNNNTVSEGGYVISAIEPKDIAELKMYFGVGAKCKLEKTSVTVEYGKKELVRTAESELALLKTKLETAKKQYKLIDYASVEAAINDIEIGEIQTLESRNEVIKKMREIEPMLVESRTVDTRSVWYTATETNAEDIKKTVAEMKKAGINELVLSSNSAKGTIIPIDKDEIPFARDPIVRRLDILQTYIDECRANDISIVVLVTVMGGSFAENHPEWFDVTNTGAPRDEIFFSPANRGYRKAFMDYVRYIITHYDVDGLQLDYIRYPEFNDNIDAGYDEATIKLFEEKTGYGEDVVRAIGKQLSAHPQWNQWWSFKTELINSWVEEIYGIVSELRPDLYISAAVASGNGVGSYCQDPAAWIKGGYIDGIYVMSYTMGINEISTNKHIAVRGDNSYLVMGCGAYRSISNKELISQTDNSIVLGADGTGYFEWGAVKNHRYTDIFASSLFKQSAVPFTYDVSEVVDRLVATAKARTDLYCETADDEITAQLQSVMEALPDKNADKDSISQALSSLFDILDDESEKYLTNDLFTAARAINMEKDEFVFVKPNDDDTSEITSGTVGESDSSTEQNSQSDSDSDSESTFPTVAVTIGAVLIALIAFAVVIKLKKSK